MRTGSLTRLALLVAATAMAGACASAPSSLERLAMQAPEEFRGHYTVGPEGSWFRPCGAAAGDSAWWATITGDAVGQVADARRDGHLVEGRPAYAHWRAVLTRGGEVGPRGPGAPALLVREVLAMRAARPDDCAAR